jgi:predicted RNase H-like HicB family nuclease
MSEHRFTVILFPAEEGYQVVIPNYPEAISWGETPEHAFAMAKESLELTLEMHAERHQEQVLPGAYASHVVVGAIDVEVPDVLLKEIRAAESESRKETAPVGTG